MNTDTTRLNDMLQILNDSKDSNEDASLEVKRAGFKRLFDRVARTKQAPKKDLRTTGRGTADKTL